MKKSPFSLIAVCYALLIATSTPSRACVCSFDSGFNIGNPANTPDSPGGLAWTEYSFISQSRNWSGTSAAPAADNPHNMNQTNWIIPGFQYFFNNQWGFSATLPFGNRVHIHEHSHSSHGDMDHSMSKSERKAIKWWGLGDMRLNVYYTGFSPNMSTGINLGLQIPTGDWRQPTVGRNMQLGTGSLDILAGFYHHGSLLGCRDWSWFVSGQLDAPLAVQTGYRPGLVVDASSGVYYTGLEFGKLKVRPIGQVVFTNQASDSGPAADSGNSAFQQLLLSPGLELNYHPFRVYGNVALPVVTNVAGNQLIAPCTVQIVVSCAF